jgi:NAD(P)-dependent dehydrogenase (short-subunit alcohol dehydrogenase family)
MSENYQSIGNVAVITGAAGGIGRAIALELAGRGYDLVVSGLEIDDLRQTADMIISLGRQGIAIEADVTDTKALDSVAVTARNIGGASALINNAAIYPSGPWSQISESEWDRVLAVNLKGAFLSCRALASQLSDKHGSVVNIASNTFFRGWPELLHYVSSKGALVGFTRALAREIGPTGVRVNAVAPGAIPTRGESIHPDPRRFSAWVIENQSLKRRGSAEEVAKVVAFLAGNESSFMTGQTLLVDGGWCMH